jgi:hypothetical protein
MYDRQTEVSPISSAFLDVAIGGGGPWTRSLGSKIGLWVVCLGGEVTVCTVEPYDVDSSSGLGGRPRVRAFGVVARCQNIIMISS